jgi:thiamine biosynthesis lipoprotein ApbE
MIPWLLALFCGVLGAQAPPASPPVLPLRMASKAFGQPMEIEVRGLAAGAAREAIERAFAEVAEIEGLTGAGLAALNAAAGRGPQTVDSRLFAILTRAASFCEWSERTHGPLGRDLYAAWGAHAAAPPAARAPEAPDPDLLEKAAERTSCERLALDPQHGLAALAAGSGLDLVGFAEGAAVDRAAEVLRQRQVTNGFLRIGPVRRGFGPGPAGKGWPVALPRLSGAEEPAGEVHLHDRSLAIAAQADHPLPGAAGSYLNQRSGRPGLPGVVAVAASTELALDAQGLATTMLISGPRQGQIRLGSLSPRPSVLWFMGSGGGPLLMVDYRWSDVNRPMVRR